jgi:hypothetical protein
MAAVQHMGKVGVCISGQVRTLMSPWVLEGFEKHVAAPLVRAGYTADVHAALVADLSRHEEYVLHRSLRQALPSYNASGVLRPPRYRGVLGALPSLLMPGAVPTQGQ